MRHRDPTALTAPPRSKGRLLSVPRNPTHQSGRIWNLTWLPNDDMTARPTRGSARGASTLAAPSCECEPARAPMRLFPREEAGRSIAPGPVRRGPACPRIVREPEPSLSNQALKRARGTIERLGLSWTALVGASPAGGLLISRLKVRFLHGSPSDPGAATPPDSFQARAEGHCRHRSSGRSWRDPAKVLGS
jgi:hypothetical protein